MPTKDDYYYFSLTNILKKYPEVNFIKDELDSSQALDKSINSVAKIYPKSPFQVLDDLREMQTENRKNEQAEEDLRPGPD